MAPLGHNIRIAKGSHLGSVLSSIEEKVSATKECMYFRIPGNHKKQYTCM